MKKRVAVAMSGGVDSSVVAALLHTQGYEVIGLTMCFNLTDAEGRKPSCCGYQGIEDARRVADTLKIRHYVVNMQKTLEEFVIKDFCAEYMRGRTPNPCIRCNQYVKFGELLKRAELLDAAFLATGHYARIKKIQGARLPGGISRSKKSVFVIAKAEDAHKDQSYFVYAAAQAQLSRMLFPLGGYIKSQVRDMAKRFGLAVADKPESQEICFVSHGSYREFLAARLPDGAARIQPGTVKDEQGAVLGQHQGTAFYTVGQREGLGIAVGYPVYVKKIEYGTNTIILGRKESIYAGECLVKKPFYSVAPLKKEVALRVKIRYNHPEALADVIPEGPALKIKFRRPQFAITPGQSAVLYHRNMVLGGGVIDAVCEYQSRRNTIRKG